jgi:heme-degrading monooxygenase HmoA
MSTSTRVRSPRQGLQHLLTSLITAAAALLPAVGAQAQARAGDGYAATSAVAAVVKVPTPWYAPKALVWSRMRETIPAYETIPGLSFKAYSIAQADGRYGGLYLWKDLASARAWFNPAWFERVEKERGAKGEVQFFEVPVALDNTPGGTPAQPDGANVSTLVTIAIPAGVGRARLVQEFQASIPTYRAVPGLLRKHFILTDDGRFGGIYLWKDRAAADQWFSAAWKERVRTTYGTEATLEWFDTAILTPSKLAANQPAVPGL